MIQTARARGVENSVPEPPTPATTSKGIIGSPINTQTNSLMRRPPKREAKHNVEEKSCHRSVDEVPMAGGGTKHRTNNGTPPPREGFSVRRASASKATAPETTASSSRAGRLDRHASSSNAMAATTTASSTPTRDGSLERRASTSNATAAAATASSRAGFFGSFDDSRYWDYAFRFTSRQDIGNKCRECKRPFLGLNEEIVVRRGGRIELRYHKGCFSMVADPRSQPSSSANVGKFVQSLKGTVAPEELYRKMRTRGHW